MPLGWVVVATGATGFVILTWQVWNEFDSENWSLDTVVAVVAALMLATARLLYRRFEWLYWTSATLTVVTAVVYVWAIHADLDGDNWGKVLGTLGILTVLAWFLVPRARPKLGLAARAGRRPRSRPGRGRARRGRDAGPSPLVKLEPASARSHAELAALFTAGYEGYFMPVSIDEAAFSFMARTWDYDLAGSLVAVDGGADVGLCMLAVRGIRRLDRWGRCRPRPSRRRDRRAADAGRPGRGPSARRASGSGSRC